jgi:hypothetical protein
MNMQLLREELVRLGCDVRWCGCHGFIFVPEKSGGLKIEDGLLHYWNGDSHITLEPSVVHEKLSALPDAAGYKQFCDMLEALGAETSSPIANPLECMMNLNSGEPRSPVQENIETLLKPRPRNS